MNAATNPARGIRRGANPTADWIHRDRCLYLARSFDWSEMNREPRRYGLCSPVVWCALIPRGVRPTVHPRS